MSTFNYISIHFLLIYYYIYQALLKIYLVILTLITNLDIGKDKENKSVSPFDLQLV